MTRVAALIGCLLAACAGTETGNPSFEGTLGYATYTSDRQAVALRVAEPDAITISAAWLVLGDVRFVDSADCDREADDAVAAHALGAGDHAREGATQTPLELVAGRYCGVRLPLLQAGDDPGPTAAGLAGHSMLVEGTLADGRKFAIRSALERELFLAAEAGGGFEMNVDRSAVTIGFDVAIWLDALAWSEAVPSESGAIEIDADHNRALLERFEDNVGPGTALFRDLDASGAITMDSQRLADIER